jgi:hypothetical protein
MGSEKTYRQGQGCNTPVAAAAIVGVSAAAASLGLVSRFESNQPVPGVLVPFYGHYFLRCFCTEQIYT